MLSVAIIDYGSGNVRSVSRAVAEAAKHHPGEAHVELTDDTTRIIAADRIVLPGVGHFADCAQGLRARAGVLEALTEAVHGRAVPFLGVCVGMQLMADVGREDFETPGLGWIGGVVERLRPHPASLPVPHMGWNEIIAAKEHPLLAGLAAGAHAYFVHSYAMTPADASVVAATTDYGGAIVAAVARDNLFGAQFHPEKSQETGLRVLANFLDWRP